MKGNKVNRQTTKKGISFNRLFGYCKLCETNSKHIYEISQNPFSENGDSISDVTVKITVEGSFYKTDGKLDISKPVHIIGKSASRQLRGIERYLVAQKSSYLGLKGTYNEQLNYWKQNQNELEHGNLTSILSVDVMKTARWELKKILRKGKDPPS